MPDSDGPALYPARERRRAGPGLGTRRLFGTAGVSFDWTVRCGRDLEGELADGQGVTLEVPATLPGWLLYALLDPTALFATLSEEAWMSGFRGDGLRTSPAIDEVGFVFGYSKSTHEDLLAGGEATLNRYALGVRLSGPGPAGRCVRATVAAGWAWDEIDFESRATLEATGPYAGAGLELRSAPGAYGPTTVALRLDARWEWLRGLDGAGGRTTARVFTAGAGVVFFW